MNIETIKDNLLSDPIALLGKCKLSFILNFIQTYNIKNFLEIGTWVGGTIYFLSKQCSETTFSTLDLNDFEKMHEMNLVISREMESWLECPIGANELKSLQYFYRQHSPTVTFYDLDEFSWEQKQYDAILIDGDHTSEALYQDLINSFQHTKHKGFIFIDDVSYKHIRKQVKSFCVQHRQKVNFLSTEVGKDLAVIRVRKKFKNKRYLLT